MESIEFQKNYQVIAKLGEGGMAFVHLALAQGLAGVRKLVVLKSVRPELLADPKLRAMFLAEARLAATLSHPNIVQTFEVAVLGGAPVLVMEYLEGQPLSRIVARGGDVPLPVRLFVLREVLAGLAYLHEVRSLDGAPLGLVHRDISPQNVFVTYDGQVKILDFGIAKTVGAAGFTEAGQIKGKVRYMAPEQMLGSALDARADVFAAGVVLWEMLTGRRLWEGFTDLQVMHKVVSGELPAPLGIEGIPPSIEWISRRAMAHAPAARYASAGAMQLDLERIVDELGLHATSRSVGAFVAEAFRDLRAATKQVIESQLRSEQGSPVSLPAPRSAERSGGPRASVTNPTFRPASRAATLRPSRRRRRRGAAWIVVASLAAAFCVVGVVRRAADGRAHRNDARAAAPFVQRAALAPSAVDHPRGPTATSDAALEASDEAAVAPEATVALTSSPAPAPLRRTPARAKSTGGTHAAPPPRACHPPYFFDETGIKHIKPECF